MEHWPVELSILDFPALRSIIYQLKAKHLKEALRDANRGRPKWEGS